MDSTIVSVPTGASKIHRSKLFSGQLSAGNTTQNISNRKWCQWDINTGNVSVICGRAHGLHNADGSNFLPFQRGGRDQYRAFSRRISQSHHRAFSFHYKAAKASNRSLGEQTYMTRDFDNSFQQAFNWRTFSSYSENMLWDSSKHNLSESPRTSRYYGIQILKMLVEMNSQLGLVELIFDISRSKSYQHY